MTVPSCHLLYLPWMRVSAPQMHRERVTTNRLVVPHLVRRLNGEALYIAAD